MSDPRVLCSETDVEDLHTKKWLPTCPTANDLPARILVGWTGALRLYVLLCRFMCLFIWHKLVNDWKGCRLYCIVLYSCTARWGFDIATITVQFNIFISRDSLDVDWIIELKDFILHGMTIFPEQSFPQCDRWTRLKMMFVRLHSVCVCFQICLFVFVS